MPRPGRQFGQLPVFATAREVVGAYPPNPGDRRWVRSRMFGPRHRETDPELWDRKYAMARRSGLASSVLSEGMDRPVVLQVENLDGEPRSVLDGHRRLAVMARDAPDRPFPVGWAYDLHEAAWAYPGRTG